MTHIAEIYSADHDEAARQAFVGALKSHVNGPMEADLAELYEKKLAARDSGQLDDVIALYEREAPYQLWGSAVYTSQDLLWESVGQTVDRVTPEFDARWQALQDRGETLGSLVLDPELALPEPIASREIHRQPGGYFHETGPDDLISPLLYFSSVELYRAAKGLGTNAKTGQPGMAPLMLKVLGEKFTGFAPKRILDLGCGPGTETLGFARAFEGAEVHGLDLSAPFLRFAHLWAEEHEIPVHYRQGNAACTPYPDGHFDLIVSHILFHETSHEILPQIMQEAQRLLAPGGVFLNADVAYQMHRIPVPKQVTNAWQVAYNGEPFWRGFAETDVTDAMRAAGFDEDRIFADYIPLGSGDYFMFGASKAG
ncbi:class I SAM-dependent methyltransferase [Altererythrobacter sp. BO-6]|uniref:class I SAM-dependent methyltransferase n=1 Tax=Altererythrobacter sp. BO-6 TaxID=2604537 RepID=UPI0013E17D84|nr:class I SAM-dependent methyltransferase [Altererythrobacter sp. BO-6]QIG53588.1 class I SAM-dependent methyltransferase [Altererythrobacter sp. BO-6]